MFQIQENAETLKIFTISSYTMANPTSDVRLHHCFQPGASLILSLVLASLFLSLVYSVATHSKYRHGLK